MKVITKEEEDAHYAAVVRGGVIGGTVGLGLGAAAVLGASRRWQAFRALTPQFRAFLVSSAATFGAITVAERHSIAFGKAQNPMNSYKDESQVLAEAERATETPGQRALEWARQNRYSIVGGSWVASIAAALTIVGRNKYLTTGQKVVHARVYAQGLTIAVLMLTGLLEVSDAKKGKGRWETVMVLDPTDPEHKRLIEKRIHHEEYAGQDLWMGEFPRAMLSCSRSQLLTRRPQTWLLLRRGE
jgi:hypothetical protein